ncbi:hypothetical protein DNU06_08325 [Putridiphycobacter roseus]|uniref:MAM domain-containing protein n=1 Tax=Putridiphycobacter roseus TaxID=2219161 RepID=A0A2W1N148_9FLAO|nr:S8 family serine peptidase [Putridiphycobacter roseus]PZE17270.1 hypothetical protein DNU06_08325 [Putridiphycobacter roseus]
MIPNLKIYLLVTFCLSFIFHGQVFAQTTIPLYLKAKTIQVEKAEKYKEVAIKLENELSINGKIYRIIQFKTLPNHTEKLALKKLGVELLNYLPKNSFYAAIKTNTKKSVLNAFHVHNIISIAPSYKLSKELYLDEIGSWAINKNTISLNGIYFKGIPKESVIRKLESIGATIIQVNEVEIVQFSIKKSQLPLVYSLPSFYYFEQIDAPSEPENLVGVTDHRSNTLATAYENGLKYDGTGVTVMMQDNSVLNQHIDYQGRFFNGNAAQTGDHGEHVGGIIGGAGNLDPTSRGMAFGADILVYNFNNTNYNTVPSLVTNNDLTITSKSYGNGLNAGYTSLASQLDQQIRMMPALVHVFSAGNSNGSGTTAAGSQWVNITGGHKAGKNVIAVGNVTESDAIASSSSRGPSADGRIKPDICAVGTNVYSTIEPNNYGNKTGTSMACPGVAGTLAQLYQAYKELNSGNNPPSGLIKATVLNTGKDLGNPGPDYIYGWGRINARKAYETVFNNAYIIDNITNGTNDLHTVTVPNGIKQLKVMVYWTDYEGSANASLALVNDINMTITDPTSTQLLPWTLSTTLNATALNTPAVPGVDNRNNMEQISVNNPIPGVYTIDINGFSIPQGPQEYYIVYEMVTEDVVLTYPIGGESFDPTKNEIIRWDAQGDTNPFSIDYSVDNGVSWTNIANSIPASSRFYTWNVPNGIATGEALVRITRGGNTSESHENFSIIGVPTGLNIDWVCADSMHVSWNAVTDATGYEVSLLGNKYMDSIGFTTNTELTISINAGQENWWSVKALEASTNCIGRRALAVYQAIGVVNCLIPIDAAITNDGSFNGTTFLECIAPNGYDLSIELFNNGSSSLSNIPVYYQLNNGSIISESYNGTLNPGANVTHTFLNQVAALNGANELVIWVNYANDGNGLNDSLFYNFNYSNSPPVSLPWSEDFEDFQLCGTASNCEEEICPTIHDFINAANGITDDIDWRTNEGNTPSASTGPTTDFNPGNNSGKYLYLEPSATPVCTNKEAYLISPCLSIEAASILKFGYHMYGTNIGSLHVDAYVNDNWVNDITPAIAGNKGNQWLVQTVDLSAYNGQIINLRFRGITGDGFRSDMAIDDIQVLSTLHTTAFDLEKEFSIYPNPSNGNYNYSYHGDEAIKISISDANGKVIYTQQLSGTEAGAIDISNYANGVYFVEIQSDLNKSIKKIIKY